MTNRITQKDLEHLVKELNLATGNPIEYSTPTACEKFTSNIGNYHLSYAYGGVQLHQVYNTSGGIRTISTSGYGTKRELYTFLRGMLAGLSNDK
jgi:hypothetical protein